MPQLRLGLLIVIALSALASAGARQATAQPVVSNVRSGQLADGSRRVEVLYDLAGASAEGAKVSIAFSIDGGRTYTIVPAAAALSGDVGAAIGNGPDRRIIWQASASLPPGLRFEDVRAAVSASETPGGNPVLTNGVPVSGLAGPSGTWQFFKIAVPQWQVMMEIRTSGGNGNCDLYLKKGQLPSSGTANYWSTGAGNDAFIQVWYPGDGDWFIGLRADSTYSDVSLVATFTDTVTALTNGQPIANLSDTTGHWQFFKIAVPQWQVMMEIRTSGGDGNCDLYVMRGALPRSGNYGARSAGASNDEFIQVPNPGEGEWFIGLGATSAYADLTLLATY